MPINVKIKGQADTDEYKAAQELKLMIEKHISEEIDGYENINGEIAIISNVTLFGQEVKDVDIVVFGKMEKGFKMQLKFRPKNQTEYVNKNIYF